MCAGESDEGYFFSGDVYMIHLIMTLSNPEYAYRTGNETFPPNGGADVDE